MHFLRYVSLSGLLFLTRPRRTKSLGVGQTCEKPSLVIKCLRLRPPSSREGQVNVPDAVDPRQCMAVVRCRSQDLDQRRAVRVSIGREVERSSRAEMRDQHRCLRGKEPAGFPVGNVGRRGQVTTHLVEAVVEMHVIRIRLELGSARSGQGEACAECILEGGLTARAIRAIALLLRPNDIIGRRHRREISRRIEKHADVEELLGHLLALVLSPGGENGTPTVFGANAVSLSPSRLSMVGTRTRTSRSGSKDAQALGLTPMLCRKLFVRFMPTHGTRRKTAPGLRGVWRNPPSSCASSRWTMD